MSSLKQSKPHDTFLGTCDIWLSNGFDEYMNLVLDDAEKVQIKKKTRKSLGRILLKGDNITLMMNTGK
ncbi:hypothetical protein Patl1_30347 [Pistacia atlantica]|uniref:Uncharacterized protein n=1 Tax=Pistacia atlantica TaxID=434234 RepID=A0ACC1ADY3_9ROSI|nr:hypothetical protein Patl1_30347 [Pistacia atlantica]